MLAGLLQEFNEQSRLLGMARANMARAKTALLTLDRSVGKLNKNWYKVMTHTFEKARRARGAGAGARAARLAHANDTAHQLAEAGRGGGPAGAGELHATRRGDGHAAAAAMGRGGVDEGLPHSRELDLAGDALGPFPVGTVVHGAVEVANSAGARVSGVESLEILDPASGRRLPKGPCRGARASVFSDGRAPGLAARPQCARLARARQPSRPQAPNAI